MLMSHRLYGTTDSGGDLTVTHSVQLPAPAKLYAVEWIDGTFVNGVDAVLSVTSAQSGVVTTLLTLTDANDDAWYFPREPMTDNTGAAVTFDGTNEIYTCPVVDGTLKLVVAQGGDTKAGGVIVYTEQ